MSQIRLEELESADSELQRFLGWKVVETRNSQELSVFLSDPVSPSDIELIISAPWEFSSCQYAVTSAEENVGGEDLIGLTGATLTGIKEDSEKLNLEFGSICISVFRELI